MDQSMSRRNRMLPASLQIVRRGLRSVALGVLAPRPALPRCDQRVSNSTRGGFIGAISLGAITALFAASVAAASNVGFLGLSSNANREINQAAWKGALIGGALGAGIGAGIGAGSNRWILIYRRW